MRSSTGIKGFARLLLGGVLVLLTTAALSGSAVTPGSKASELDACVAPTAEMRRYHMLYLKHDRIETVRQGNRNIKYSLAQCVDCHAAKDGKGGYKPVNGEGQFCDSCHNYTAVQLACFQCHRKVPEDKQSALESMKGALPVNGNERLFGLLLKDGDNTALSAEEFARLHAISQGD
jgi:hypothetical protein